MRSHRPSNSRVHSPNWHTDCIYLVLRDNFELSAVICAAALTNIPEVYDVKLGFDFFGCRTYRCGIGIRRRCWYGGHDRKGSVLRLFDLVPDQPGDTADAQYRLAVHSLKHGTGEVRR